LSLNTAAAYTFNLTSQADRGWWERAHVCADLLAPLCEAGDPVRSLADVGCGDRKLERVLAERHMGLAYLGFDLVPQSDEVVPFDLNVERLPLAVDVLVLLGVTEYLEYFVTSLARQAPQCRYLILSHVMRGPKSPSAARLLELGWRNHFDEEVLVSRLKLARFDVAASRWTPDGKSLLLQCVSQAWRPRGNQASASASASIRP
jgi:hypothetical protein